MSNQKIVVFTGPRNLEVGPLSIINALERADCNRKSLLRVIVGDCPTGVDACVRKFCEDYGVDFEVVPAPWSEFGKIAGPIRNMTMVREYLANTLIAFCRADEPITPGTSNCIAEGIRAGLTVFIEEVYKR